MVVRKLNKNWLYGFIALSSLTLSLTFCSKKFEQDSYAPSDLPRASIKTISANGGSTLYCSISGGCPIQITGKNFFPKAKVMIGPYECLNTVVSDDQKEITCDAGPGRTGVFDISVINFDGLTSEFDETIVDPTTLQFSYASFLYVGVQDSPGKVYGYAQNPVSGQLLSIAGSPFSVAANNQTYGTVISPNNKFLYAANVSTGTISVYSINPEDGRLAAIGTPTPSGGSSPNGLFFHPTGNYLYVTNQGGNSVSAFSVNTDGTLVAVVGSPFSAGTATTLNGIVVDKDGKYVYVASMGGSGGVVGYSIDETTGALTLIPGSPFSNTNGGFANTGDGITVHPNNRWIYMGLVNRKRVATYEIDPDTGALTGVGTPTLNNSTTGYTDNGGSGANVSPDGLYFYGTAFSTVGADPKKVIAYTIDQTTGELTLASDADAGGGPNDVRVDTNGLFAYTCNSANTPSISMYSRNASTGALTALSPRDIAIPTSNYGPGIMVIQK